MKSLQKIYVTSLFILLSLLSLFILTKFIVFRTFNFNAAVNGKIVCFTPDRKYLKITQKQCNDYHKAWELTEASKLPEEFMKNWETEYNLPVIEKNKNYDFVFLGTSHARIFSRFNNHQRVEKILNGKMINISQGDEKGGIISQQTYLRYFYSRGNTAKTLVYFVDPYMFLNDEMDFDLNLYRNEPFRLDFYYQLLVHPPKNPKSVDLYASKLYKKIPITTYPDYLVDSIDDTASTPSADVIEKRVDLLYRDSYIEEEQIDIFADLMETVQVAKRHNTRVVIIIPSTMLPAQPNDHKIINRLASAAHKDTYEFHDFSRAVQDLNLYYDIDHLNTKGIQIFTEKLLKPLLK